MLAKGSSDPHVCYGDGLEQMLPYVILVASTAHLLDHTPEQAIPEIGIGVLRSRIEIEGTAIM